MKAAKREMVASGLAHGRILSLAPGKVRLGFAPQDGMFRRQVERAQKETEALLARLFGVPTALVIESVSAAEAPAPSIAEQDDERAKARSHKITREAREHPNVLAAMRVLGGTVEFIKELDTPTDEGFASAPEDGEDAPSDDS